VTLGVSIPIAAIQNFLWLGAFHKTKMGPIGDFFKHVSPKCAVGRFLFGALLNLLRILRLSTLKIIMNVLSKV